jgi:uncharacterized protein (UPF0276 family)
MLDGSLPLPADVTYVEAGMHVVGGPLRWSEPLATRDVSLHLARAPWFEPDSVRSTFCAEVRAAVEHGDATSVGMHLCGPYRGGLGEFGFGNPFPAATAALRAVQQLVEELRAAVDRPLLVENANYYDGAPRLVVEAVDAVNDVCRASGVGQILDLAHLYMNASNAGVDPFVLLGRVDLRTVDVVHLSGVTIDRSGLLHDGHTEPVAEPVWRMLETALPLLDHAATVVVEHTDAGWSNRVDDYHLDLDRLEKLLDVTPTLRREPDWDRVAIGYLAGVVLPRQEPELHQQLGVDGFRLLVEEWARDFLRRADQATDRYPVLTSRGDGVDDAQALDVVVDFRRHVDRLLRPAD